MDLWEDPFSSLGGGGHFFGGSGNPYASGPGYAWGVTGLPALSAFPTAGSSNALINTGIQGALGLASGFLQQSNAAGAQTAARNKAINDRWEQLVQQALAVFTAVSAKLPNITASDLAAAQNAYDVLAQFVAQYPTEYVLNQWQSSAYQGAAVADLNKYQAALAGGAASTATTSGAGTSQLASVAGATSPTASSFLGGLVTTLESNPILTLVILLGAAFVIVKK